MGAARQAPRLPDRGHTHPAAIAGEAQRVSRPGGTDTAPGGLHAPCGPSTLRAQQPSSAPRAQVPSGAGSRAASRPPAPRRHRPRPRAGRHAAMLASRTDITPSKVWHHSLTARSPASSTEWAPPGRRHVSPTAATPAQQRSPARRNASRAHSGPTQRPRAPCTVRPHPPGATAELCPTSASPIRSGEPCRLTTAGATDLDRARGIIP